MKRVKSILGLAVILILTVSIPLYASEISKGVKVTNLGHAAFKIISPKGVVIYIDPFLSRNPKTALEMKTVEKADLILVTHGHGDHVGDTLAIAEKTNAKIVAINALHSSSVTETEEVSSGQKKARIVYAGDPAGFVIRLENGFSVYHAGDTAVFGDMKIIGEIYKPELSLLPIGSHFTMDPTEATYAAKLLGSKYVIPMHYGTFPLLTGTPEMFLKLMKEVPQTKVLVLKPGETID